MERVNIDKVYHPFITGAYNKLVGEMMHETGARINVPPPSVNKTEIVITGEKEQVALAVAMIKKIAEDKVCSLDLWCWLETAGTAVLSSGVFLFICLFFLIEILEPKCDRGRESL